MLDIHCHLLPGIDDGPDTLEESIEMARLAVRDGITATVATPHFAVGSSCADFAQVNRLVQDINSTLRKEVIPLTVYPGMELKADPELPDLYRRGTVLSLCNSGKYLLLDCHPAVLPINLDKLVFQLMLSGAKVILAHPERNREIIKHPEMMFSMLQKGVLLQLNTGSLTGDFGTQVRSTAETFLMLGWVSFIASDGHSTTWRKPVLSPAFEVASKIIGEEQALRLVLHNPSKVIQGEDLQAGELIPYQGHKSWYVRLCPWINRKSGGGSRGTSRS